VVGVAKDELLIYSIGITKIYPFQRCIGGYCNVTWLYVKNALKMNTLIMHLELKKIMKLIYTHSVYNSMGLKRGHIIYGSEKERGYSANKFFNQQMHTVHYTSQSQPMEYSPYESYRL
jgi:hypothetical protein